MIGQTDRNGRIGRNRIAIGLNRQARRSSQLDMLYLEDRYIRSIQVTAEDEIAREGESLLASSPLEQHQVETAIGHTRPWRHLPPASVVRQIADHCEGAP